MAPILSRPASAALVLPARGVRPVGHARRRPERPPLGSSITVDALGTLPSSANLFSLLDTAIPDVIADRIDTGGLSAGEPARVGAHGSTWTQTIYHVGDVDITDPNGTGTPLLAPGVAEWDRVDVATGLMPIDARRPGMAVAADAAPSRRGVDRVVRRVRIAAGAERRRQRRPRRRRSRGSTPGRTATSSRGGPAVQTVGAFGESATWTRSSHFERAGRDADRRQPRLGVPRPRRNAATARRSAA